MILAAGGGHGRDPHSPYRVHCGGAPAQVDNAWLWRFFMRAKVRAPYVSQRALFLFFFFALMDYYTTTASPAAPSQVRVD